ncbi:unnamed protein product [Hermetia illucens]|uniref:Uncharacterized protein n=1 Tax=Hermetia illucens TaxID=343691 RepID=A0A7R8UCZ1_HERIL|nr:unnamed protein product [Hermetia illucens]
MSIPRRTASKEDLTTITSTQGSSKENVSENNNTTNDTQYPEYVRSLKERECWKLFQKMMNKGVTISYDTILRGMLTPTELRLIQKQKELEEARKNKELEEVGERK